MSNPSNPSIAQQFKAGDNLAGCYTLKEMLPAQGYWVVWLARDEELNKDIALHFVPDSVAADSRAMTELKQEAKRNRQLIHPRIIRIHDLVEDEKWAAISMDYVPGETLGALQAKHTKNAFNPSELAAGVTEVCQTLEDAHRIDLFHRDLTSENLVATGNGVMIQKFGLSRVVLDSMARTGQQIENARDLAYISPQQLDGERAGRTDDIYSLGATLFDLLTGAPPFSGGDVISQIRLTVPPSVSERRTEKEIGGEPLPKSWDETIAACLAKTPEERPKTAAEAGSRFISAKLTAGHAATVAAAAAATAEAAVASEPQEPPAASKISAADQGTKPLKRPWASKTPVIAEATVLSKTQVPKEPKFESTSEASTEDAGAGKKGGGPTTPTGFPLRAFVEVEGHTPRPKTKSPGLIVAGLVLAVIIVVAFIVARNNGGSSTNTTADTASTTGTSDNSAISTETPASTPTGETPTPVPTPVNVAYNSNPPATPANTPTPEETPLAVAPSTPPKVAEPPTPGGTPLTPAGTPVSAATIATMTAEQTQQLVADKTKAIDDAKAALAAAEKAAADKAAAQTQAASAVQQIQAEVKQKTDGAAAAKKAADDAALALKQKQDALQKAQADADAAQKAAADKAQAAEQVRKAVQDAQTAAQQQQTAQQQAEADAAQAAKVVADREKAADEAARIAADAEKARRQQLQSLAQAQADLGQIQAGIQQARAAEQARKAAEEAARIQQEREAETAKLSAQAAAAAKAAEDAQKALKAAQDAVANAEKVQKQAEDQAAAARNGVIQATTPAATPPHGAAAGSPPPSISVQALNPHLKVDQVLSNSLGMRFAPVGKVFFSIWLTRVQDFEAFANATGYTGSEWRNPGFKQAPDHPVVNVSWNDANKFCLWLTEKEHNEGILSKNQTYRLPTDLEWSNAVGLPQESGRTPESRDMDVPDVYPWGTQWPPPAGAGNYTGEETDSDVAIKGYNDGFAWTSPVGSFNPNKFGLYDMGGNVWEWCLDWWNPEQKAKVLRGGSWYNGALKLSLLSSCRIHASADQGTDNYGFRVVLTEEIAGAKHHP